MTRNRVRTAAVAACLLALASFAALRAAQEPPTMKRADALFEQKNYREAADRYQALVEAKAEGWRRAAEQLIACNLELRLYDDALKAAEDYIVRTAGTPYEARTERLTGNLYMLLPHYGTRAGGKFYRGEYRQGVYLQSWRYDRRQALAHMERARELYAKHDGDRAALDALPEDERANWHNERMEAVFDLANVVSRFTIYDDQPFFWYRWWAERDESLAETAGERDFEEGYSYWEWQRKRPIGLRVGPDGAPLWPAEPKAYSPDLGDDEKLLYLLAEVRELDGTKEHRYAALSYYRQAMLARKQFGMDRLNAYAAFYYDGRTQPLQAELKQFSPWDLRDAEALTLVGGRIAKVELPQQFDVLALLRRVAAEHAGSGVADQARYAVGLYYQSRQQYTKTLDEYAALRQAFPQSPWAETAAGQVGRIKAVEAAISQAGVQLPGKPAVLQVRYRNLDRIWFVAREVDLKSLLGELRAAARKETEDVYRYLNLLQQWSYHVVLPRPANEDQWVRRIVAKYIGPEVARWSAPVRNDGTYRYSEAELQTPLQGAGAYVVYAYTSEPPQADAAKAGEDAWNLGVSRAALVLTDLAFVEKHTDKGNLYYVADAATGAPVPGAAVSVLVAWTVYDQKLQKGVWHTSMSDLRADENGMAVLPGRPEGAQLHALVSAPGGRLAWSGMDYWWHYQPSRMQEGTAAYVITDRPVYRPQQTVHFKVWVRRMHEGVMENAPQQQFAVTVYDPRGNAVYSAAQTTDDFGGVAGELTLGEEPPLGVYRVQVSDEQYAGGGNFRVEEYKKPEFEVTVEPDKAHAKLGEKLSAAIKASYYFGAPVTEATVKYRVFREEYAFSYYFPGEWDWLYGAGYGQAWYSYDWFPWWSRYAGCCWAPPVWWWGYRPANPVRELVAQGEQPIGRDGTLKVEINTAPALRDHPDRDHRYVVQAEVRDPSRRVITGEGDVKATRQSYYALIQSDRGYYVPGEEMAVTVRCLTPDGRPVQTEGVVTVSEVVFGGPGNARIEERVWKRWSDRTDERGSLTFRLRAEKSGQFEIRFEAPDEWGGAVTGHGLVWVCGQDFSGRLYRFNELELVTDKRTYKPGETCHLMVNTRRPDSYVLLADKVDSGALLRYRLVRVPGGHTIVDIPVQEGDKPNFYVEATTVSDLRVHEQAVSICVPPEDEVVRVAVATDKPEYRPGEKAIVNLAATAPSGEPAQVQVVLSAFDKSVLYIQPEFTPLIAKFFHGMVRSHQPRMITNLLEQFAAWNPLLMPYQDLWSLPPGWQGTWGAAAGGWSYVGEPVLLELGEGLGGASYGGGALRKAGAANMAMDAIAAPAGGPMAAEAAGAAAGEMRAGGPTGAPPGPGAFAEAEVRKAFADTAFWTPSVTTGPDGKATVSFEMPENLTTWKVNAWALGKDSKAGQASAEAVTTKDLIVRLQAPRFFMEYDEVVISANVHNYLKTDKTARVSLEFPAEALALLEGYPAVTDVQVPAGGQKRVDWRVRVLKEGQAALTVKALTDEESDAMQMTLPVLVHGMMQQVPFCGSARPDEVPAARTIEFTVPQKRRPELTRLEVQFAPSLVGAMMDALPYCLDYPYGCTEQTVSRFLPAVLTLKTLQSMGIRLEDVRSIRGRMAEVRRVEAGEHRTIYADSPIFDSDELRALMRKGLDRIADMQHGDGGWAWWKEGDSSAYLTSYVLYALCTAQQCDVAVEEGMIGRGMEFLRAWELGEMAKPHWRPDPTHAFTAYVLSLKGLRAAEDKAGDCVNRLFDGRDQLNVYGKALLSLTLANLGDEQRARLVLQNVMQYLEENRETEVAWFRTPDQGWWNWWNNDIETNAWCLRAIIRLQPKSDVAPKLVKWLLENRRNGYYWRSTRDTTLCVAAMSDFVVASGEGKPDYTLTLDLDNGAVVKKVRINKDNFFTYDNRFVIEGVSLAGGKHTLTVTKEGPGALYFSASLSYFTKEQDIKAAGLQLKLERSYYLLKQIPFSAEVEGAKGQKLAEERLRYERVPLKDGDRIASGDVVQVELRVTSDNDYTFLVFEDMKPAGCEAVEVRSGGQGQEGFWSYMELRDEKVAIFADTIARGEHLLRYRLRAQTPGVFHALPAVVQGMYVPELRGNSAEAVIRVVDR